ncbi:Predicted arabinose efflux permease, MFS family [Duganella sp. CF458]|uniref:MFS transporter n=1 Tax=Duganella sp. CF458 TaxID=1884368 RepID=UPI0008F2D59D|nr:MFS transporter [Duganella sp. CF458]SFF54633.1 Predicted arabinose efflux permease, MFS family [Duganella sp. CF458]
MQALHRLAIPLASLTALGLLASDLYLPAIPVMAAELGASIPSAQATMALFMAALALSQLAWGWAADRFGDRRTIMAGTALLGGGSLVCAMAPAIDAMLAGRLLQGLGAGAATVAVPALIRRRFNEADAVKALAMVAMAESTVPALGPVAGAAIVLYADWRTTFWLIAAMSLLLLPLVARIVGRAAQLPPAASHARRGYAPLLRNRRYLRYALSYAVMFGALLMYVASAPVLVTHTLGLGIEAFAILQMCGVLAFMVGASAAVRMVQRLGQLWLMRTGTLLQCLAGAGLMGMALAGLVGTRGLVALAVLAALFCAGLGLRGPATMGGALHAAGEDAGKGAGLLMFFAFACVAGATQLVAPFLHYGLLPLGGLLFAMVGASALLLPR